MVTRLFSERNWSDVFFGEKCRAVHLTGGNDVTHNQVINSIKMAKNMYFQKLNNHSLLLKQLLSVVDGVKQVLHSYLNKKCFKNRK